MSTAKHLWVETTQALVPVLLDYFHAAPGSMPLGRWNGVPLLPYLQGSLATQVILALPPLPALEAGMAALFRDYPEALRGWVPRLIILAEAAPALSAEERLRARLLHLAVADLSPLALKGAA